MKNKICSRIVAVILAVLMAAGSMTILPKKVLADTDSGTDIEYMKLGLYVGLNTPITTINVVTDGKYTLKYSGEAIAKNDWRTMYIGMCEGNVATARAAKIDSIKINNVDYTIPSVWRDFGDSVMSKSMGKTRFDVAFYNRWGMPDYNIGDGSGDDLNDLEITDMEVTFEVKKLPEFSYVIADDGETIDLRAYNRYENDVVIPEEIDGYPVSRISDSIFHNFSEMRTITIPSSVTYIEAGTFKECLDLEEIHVADDNEVYMSENGVLYDKTQEAVIKYPRNIRTFELPGTIKSIGSFAFYGCLFTSVEIPENITSIGEYAFGNCYDMNGIMIPSSVTEIGTGAIYNGQNQTIIYGYASSAAETYAIENNVSFIDLTGKKTIRDCNITLDKYEFLSYEDFTPQVSVEYDGEVLTENVDYKVTYDRPDVIVKGMGDYIGTMVITTETKRDYWTYTLLDDGTIEIKPDLLPMDTAETLIIPDTYAGYKVTRIGHFDENLNASYVVVPEGVKSISDDAFSLCTGLKGIELPDTLKSIGANAFFDCTNLTEIELPEGLESIGDGAFNACSSLRKIAIPASVKTIGDRAFSGCGMLGEVSLADGVCTIGSRAFDDCIRLKEIDLPASLTSLSNDTFINCEELTAINVDDDNTTYCSIDGLLYTKDRTVLINKPTKAKSFSIPETLVEIEDYACCKAFPAQIRIKNLELPDGITKIGAQSFDGNIYLKNIIIPKSVTEIGEYAFEGCDNLTIFGYSDSYAETYAKEHEIPFFDIEKYKAISSCSITLDNDVCIYDGGSKKPEVTVKYKDTVLTENVDYKVEYTKNTDVGIANVKVSGIGKYVGSEIKQFVIIPTDVDGYATSSSAPISENSYTVKNNVDSVNVNIFVGDANEYMEWTKYIIKVTYPSGKIEYYAFGGAGATWSNDMDGDGIPDVEGYGSDQWLATIGDEYRATLKIPVAGKGTRVDFYCNSYMDYDGIQYLAVITGDRIEITDEMVEIEGDKFLYDENAITPSITVRDNDKVLVEDEDYRLEYTNNTKIGEATVTVIGIGNYTGKVTKNFEIVAVPVTGISLNKYSLTIEGRDKTEKLIATVTPYNATDKTVKWTSSNTAVAVVDDDGNVTTTGYGEATITASVNNGEYEESCQVKVNKYTITDMRVMSGDYEYTEKPICPSVKAYYNNLLLTENVDYTVTYINNTEVGTATVIIEGKGDYTGTVKADYNIVKAPQSVNAVVESSEIYIGDSTTITVNAIGDVSYTSSDETIAVVDENGVIKGVGAGTAEITVTASGDNNHNSGSTKFLIVVKTKLSVPTLLSATNTTSGANIKWDKVEQAEGYILYRKTGKGSWSRVADIKSGTTTSYTDKTVKSGTTYTYTVRAYAGNTMSDWKSTKTIKYLATPTVSPAANITSGVQVKWTKVTGANGYILYRKTGNGGWTRLADIKSGTTTSYTDKTAKSGTTYTYTVRAYSGSYISSYNAAGKTVKRLTTPTLGTISNTASGITVKWTKVTGASGYYVYRKSGNGSWTRLATVSGSTLSYTDTKTANGTVYTYTVRAYSGSYTSSYNATGKTIARLTRPSISSVTNQTGRKITVKWNRNTKATGYQIYYKTGSTVKIVTVSGNANVSKVISSLTKGKTYTVYVRSYKKSGSATYYSAWSTAKSVKITK